MSMNLNENYGDQLFCQEMADEMYRLDLISQTYDFISQRQLSALMVKRGLSCLDIGSGNGSLAEWLTKQDNVTEVIALDRFTHSLEKRLAGVGKLKIVQHDLNNDDFSGEFDIINIRFVLMHLRNRVNILNKISEWLKPGGWLIVSDIIDISPNGLENQLYRKVMLAMWDVLINTIGTDKLWSHSLTTHLHQLHLQNISNEIFLPSINKNSPMAKFWYLTWRAMHERLIKMSDLNEATLASAEMQLADGDMITLSPGMMTCIGQKKSL